MKKEKKKGERECDKRKKKGKEKEKKLIYNKRILVQGLFLRNFV